MNTACYIQNRVLIRPIINKIPYELWRGRRPNISYFHAFGCECYILNTRDQLGKFDSKVDKGIFLGYSETSKAYRIYNSRTSVVEESIHVKFNDGLKTDRSLSDLECEFADLEIAPSVPDVTDEARPSDKAVQMNEASTSSHKDWKFVIHHPQD